MVYSVIIKTLAEEDITEIVKWYIEKSEQLTKELLENIDHCLNALKMNPKHFQKKYGEMRVIYTQKFPYGIFYTIKENTVFVHAILHNKQNPQSAIERI